MFIINLLLRKKKILYLVGGFLQVPNSGHICWPELKYDIKLKMTSKEKVNLNLRKCCALPGCHFFEAQYRKEKRTNIQGPGVRYFYRVLFNLNLTIIL